MKIHIFHQWKYDKYKSEQRDTVTTGWWNFRICMKCRLVQQNIPSVVWSKGDYDRPLDDVRVKNHWHNVGYNKVVKNED